jgi:Ser/Thr protein kinase RdoA (MazF antagonist)
MNATRRLRDGYRRGDRLCRQAVLVIWWPSVCWASHDGRVDVTGVVAAVEDLWGLDTVGWSVLVDGPAPVLALPAAGAVMHVGREEVGAARIEALHRARARLAEDGVPVVELLTSRTGNTWQWSHGRVVEVEQRVDHDGRMNTWPRLRAGCSVLAQVHNAWIGLDLGREGEACDWANWISPADVLVRCEIAAGRLRTWGLGGLAADVIRLAELTAEDHGLPTQVVHGDFWDNNIYLRHERVVAVTDFEFLGRRPRIDDLALLLYFADEQPYFDGAGFRDQRTRLAELTPLVHAYASRLATPLTHAELTALPITLARQPLWTYGIWLVADIDDDHARRDALATAPAVARALEIATDPEPWAHAFNRT